MTFPWVQVFLHDTEEQPPFGQYFRSLLEFMISLESPCLRPWPMQQGFEVVEEFVHWVCLVLVEIRYGIDHVFARDLISIYMCMYVRLNVILYS